MKPVAAACRSPPRVFSQRQRARIKAPGFFWLRRLDLSRGAFAADFGFRVYFWLCFSGLVLGCVLPHWGLAVGDAGKGA